MDNILVDAMAAKLITSPDAFDVIVTTNLFGDILSDEAAALMGSLGMAGSINQGSTYAVGQAVHGSAPDIAVKNVANPIGMIKSFNLLLEWYGAKICDNQYLNLAKYIDYCVNMLIKKEAYRTLDLLGNCSTRDFSFELINVATNFQEQFLNEEIFQL